MGDFPSLQGHLMVRFEVMAKPDSTPAALPRVPVPGQVLDKLRDYIIDHDLQPGDRLPTERQLAEDLQVSRNSVREALTSLEAVGAVSRRPKIGCVLQSVDLSVLAEVIQFQLIRDDRDLQELYTARVLLEDAILPLAVANATQEDIDFLNQTLVDLKQRLTAHESVHDVDEAFHRGLFAAAHNKFLLQFGSLIQVFFRESRKRLRSNPDHTMRTLEEHRAILGAIIRRDAKAARKHMQKHLDAYIRTGTIRFQ
jgi:GntR family transcriptional repressor for pyruvate dehydrogenase complex